jgi:hypothetical protein
MQVRESTSERMESYSVVGGGPLLHDVIRL